MTIAVTEPPSKRASGRHPRLSEQDIKDLADGMKVAFEALKKGKTPHWLTDNEPVTTKTAAYQRAQSARDLVGEALPNEYKIDHIKTAVEPVDASDLTKGYIWKIGPRPEGEKVRKTPRGKTKLPKDALPNANGPSQQT